VSETDQKVRTHITQTDFAVPTMESSQYNTSRTPLKSTSFLFMYKRRRRSSSNLGFKQREHPKS